MGSPASTARPRSLCGAPAAHRCRLGTALLGSLVLFGAGRGAVPCGAGGCRALPPGPAEDLALQLAQAIEDGDEEAAAQCAVALARQQATLSILLKESNYPPDDIR